MSSALVGLRWALQRRNIGPVAARCVYMKRLDEKEVTEFAFVEVPLEGYLLQQLPNE